MKEILYKFDKFDKCIYLSNLYKMDLIPKISIQIPFRNRDKDRDDE